MQMLKLKLRNIRTIFKFMSLKNTNITTTEIENTFLKNYQKHNLIEFTYAYKNQFFRVFLLKR